ncbi:MAG: ABC transporter substrate-binding protein, partial [Oscillospiraceae bacterium]|nr:ABC transporter substrate-binding protein [Oscillospiraceae bacterium]
MKKLLALILSVVMAAGCFTACSAPAESTSEETNSESEIVETVEGIDINLAGMSGPTSMGLVGMLDKSAKGETVNNYNFTLAGAADEITPKLVKGELDIAAVPANLASVLYNNTEGKIQILAINNLGVLYVVEQGETIKSFADLKGKTIYSTGKGTTPEYALNYLLTQNGVDPAADVTIEWKSEAAEIVAVLKQNPDAIAVLPQPFVTAAQSQVEGLKVALSFNDEWNALGNGSSLVTGVIVARKAFVEENPAQVAAFLDEFKASTEYINTNVEEGAVLVENLIGVKAGVAKKAIPNCNIKFFEGEEMKAVVSGYLQTLFDQNPKAVGGKMPADD